jgi:hypothetical protein
MAANDDQEMKQQGKPQFIKKEEKEETPEEEQLQLALKHLDHLHVRVYSYPSIHQLDSDLMS